MNNTRAVNAAGAAPYLNTSFIAPLAGSSGQVNLRGHSLRDVPPQTQFPRLLSPLFCLALLLSGCRSRSKSQQDQPLPTTSIPSIDAINHIYSPWNLQSEDDLKVVTESGDPSLGSLLIVQQIHPYEGLEQQNPDLYDKAMKSQLMIYHEILQKLQVDIVFPESLHVNIDSTALRQGRIPAELFDFDGSRARMIAPPEEITYFWRGKELFRNGIDGNGTIEQRQWIDHWTIVFAYAFSRDGVRLIRTISPKEQADFLYFIQENQLDQAPTLPNDPIIWEFRETALAREVRDFMMAPENKPCRATVIFGYEHRFDDDFKNIGFQPQVQTVLATP